MRRPVCYVAHTRVLKALSRFFLLSLLMIISGYSATAAAGCSPYLGRATINEIFRQSQGGNINAFTEVKRLDSSIGYSTYKNWNLKLCRSGGGCKTASLDQSTANLPWIVLDQTAIPYTYYDIAGGMDALLTDANGDIIDYVSVANWSSDSSYLTACSYFFDTTANEALDNTFDVNRNPDGTGDWTHSSGNSGGTTTNDTNNGDSSGPAVSVPATLSVLQGETASITVSLDKPAPRGGVTVTFELRDGTAAAGTDYTTPGTLSITIPRYQTQGTIDISTILTDKTGSSNFYLVLTNATNAYLTSQLTTITINPALTALLHFDEATWDGTSGEVTNEISSTGNGTSYNGAYTASPNPALSGLSGTCRYGVFDGSNDYVSIPDNSSLDFNGDFTVTAWINPATLPSGSNLFSIVSKDTNYEFHLDSSGRIYWWWQYQYHNWWGSLRTDSRTLRSNSSVSTNSWSHVAIVYSKSTNTQTIYINGSAAGSASYNDESLDTNNYPLYIGADIESGNGNLISSRFFDGLIDEVQVYKRALSQTEVDQVYKRRHDCSAGAPTLDHIRLIHDGQGLTCVEETITVKACANSDCSTLYTEPVSVNFTDPATGWGSDPLTVTNGSTDVSLSHTSAGSITLSASASSPSATNSTRCFNTSGTETCSMSFTDTGIIIDGDDSDDSPTTVESDIITQIAGKPTNQGYQAKNVLVRAVRKDDNSSACVAAVQNKVLDSLVSYTVPAASLGLSDNTFNITGNNTVTLNSAGNTGTLKLSFDNAGTAPITIASDDSGQYAINISMALPITDGSGSTTGSSFNVSDSTNSFIVRPLAIFADASGNPKTQTTSGTVFKAAGSANPFNISAKALRWTSARDTDNNGKWDSCGNAGLSDPGTGYSRLPQWNLGQPTPTIQLPSGGNNGALTYASAITFSAGSSSSTATSASYDEVGIFQLQTDSANNFLTSGTTLEVCSPYIGRFTPSYFALSATSLTNRVASACSPSSSFTYIGEDFEALFTLTAKNSDGATTGNYIPGFSDRFNNTFNSGALNNDSTAPVNLSTNLSTPTATMLSEWKDTTSPIDTADGAATFSLRLHLNRASEVGPYNNFVFGVNPVDQDGISLNSLDLDVNLDSANDHASIAQTKLRFGRMQLLDAYGPQTNNLTMSFVTEYYNGTSFVENTDDSCTDLPAISGTCPSLNGISFIAGTWSDNLQQCETTPIASSISDRLTTGLGTFDLSAPGINNDGSVDVTIDMTNLSWLRCDGNCDDTSDDDGSYTEAPYGKATFGMYRGDDRFLIWQETQ